LMIVFGIDHRSEKSARWELLLVNGVVDFGLAGFLLGGFLLGGGPESALWALALLVGIDLIFGGGSLVVIALEARRTATN
jgi:uncharacterized membrane protein HdeD (DUF308 family)